MSCGRWLHRFVKGAAQAGTAWVVTSRLRKREESSARRRTKQCPDCAETDILVGASKCKHCGHEFDASVIDSD
jgi:ribosomal protein L37AE/L43A